MDKYVTPDRQPLTVGHDEVHVWKVPLDACQGEIDLLASDERERVASLHTELLRRRFIGARSGLRTILARYLDLSPADVAFVYDAIGKPRLDANLAPPALDLPQPESSQTSSPNSQPAISFNLSHSGDLAVVAVATGVEIGIDIERLRPVKHLDDLARRYFHPNELRRVLSQDGTPRLEMFFRCWTRKEAVLKAIGTGVQYPLETIDLPLTGSVAEPIDVPAWRAIPRSRLWLKSLEVAPGYTAALASTAKRPSVIDFELASS